MDKIKLLRMECSNNRIDYYFDLPEKIKHYLRIDNHLFIEFPISENIESLPKSILAIPFVATMSCIAFINNYSIVVDELDEGYYNSILETINSLSNIYNVKNRNISILANSLVKNENVKDSNKCSLFFTGGLDATSAFIETYDKEPCLINIWGGDTALGDDYSHNNLEDYLKKICDNFKGVSYSFIKSNAREIFLEKEIDKDLIRIISKFKFHGYWASFAHIIVMTGVITPYLYINNISTHYIGSTYDGGQKYYDGNHNDVVDSLNYLNIKYQSVDNECDRLNKAKKLVNFKKENGFNFELKVCWNKNKGNNCSNCEKCYRTIMGIVVSKGDPNEYGFKVDKQKVEEIIKYLNTHILIKEFWKPIIDEFKNDEDHWHNKKFYYKFLKVKINSFNAWFATFLRYIKKGG